MGIHPRGLAQLLNHASCLDPSDAFDRGVIYVSCSVVVGATLSHTLTPFSFTDKELQTSEKLLDASLNVNKSSRCWNLYNSVISQTSIMNISQSAGSEFALTQRLAKLIGAIADFLLSPRSVSELWRLYRVAATLVAEFSQRCDRTYTRDASPDPTSELPPEPTPADRLDTRCFIFALTNALLMNAVLSVHYPNATELTEFRASHASRVLPLSMKSSQLKPIGAGFVGVYLSHVWDTDFEEFAAGGGRETGSDGRGSDSAVRRSVAFSGRLEGTLQGMLDHPPVR